MDRLRVSGSRPHDLGKTESEPLRLRLPADITIAAGQTLRVTILLAQQSLVKQSSPKRNLVSMSACDEHHRASAVAKTHISLNVRDIERSVAFYEAFFGQPAHKRRPGYANFDIAQPPLKLALQEQAHVAGVGTLSHLGVQVATTSEFRPRGASRIVGPGLV
jgi:catechol-2,3-dioxygenase